MKPIMNLAEVDHGEEEMFLILEGEGEVRFGDKLLISTQK